MSSNPEESANGPAKAQESLAELRKAKSKVELDIQKVDDKLAKKKKPDKKLMGMKAKSQASLTQINRDIQKLELKTMGGSAADDSMSKS